MTGTAPSSNDPLWAVVLAGGEGVRLRPLARRVCGEERPKQYVPLLGSRTLLGQTLDRVGLLVSPERTVVVSVGTHWRYLAAEQSGRAVSPRVLFQPDNRGTAAGILYPAYWIASRDPDAVVAVFPSDHFVLEQDVFMAHVGDAARAARARPDRLVLLGARPAGPETEYGWIERGELLGMAGGRPLRAVRAFHEKPTEAQARRYLTAGHLWNTLVVVATTGALIEAGRRQLPAMSARLERLAAFAGSEHEAFAARQAYALMRPANFSREVLEPGPASLAVSELPPVTWSDLGTPRRVLELLDAMQLTPPWLADSLPA